MSEKLLPCPFCGSEAGIAGDGTSWEVGCSADECYVSMFDINRERAIVSWNKRATDTLPTYYILRRTVGETTMHYEYFNDVGTWLPFIHLALIVSDISAAKSLRKIHGRKTDKIVEIELIDKGVVG